MVKLRDAWAVALSGSVALALSTLPAHATSIYVDLGTAGSFAVLAGTTVTNTGASVIDGNLGVAPGSAIAGFPPGTASGTTDAADAVALQAHTDLIAAFASALTAEPDIDLSGQDLGAMTLTPGVYSFTSAAQLTGTLTLNALGDPSAAFLFLIGSTLTTASASSVVFANSGPNDSVIWQVGSSAALGTTTSFLGDILALADITLNTGASIACGGALAINGAVNLDSNSVSTDASTCNGATTVTGSVPEPGSGLLVGMGLLLFLAVTRYRRQTLGLMM